MDKQAIRALFEEIMGAVHLTYKTDDGMSYDYPSVKMQRAWRVRLDALLEGDAKQDNDPAK